ncbi:putative damage-inducible protein DinB [Algoriphagus sp. 4150]|uniref:DinB family protein n=1 Tax=Algoriphagus sp. 4150 TaxID=2817756 RepID=UPI002856E118|nr:DinB family protein [Algoriphagus sp. 4150]MDR7130908.1 putative damage-inducible protein DinB [Algoriphagus sp. 4150]
MKTLIRILIVIGVLIAIPLVVALFVKKEYAVEKEIAIDKSKSEVFEYIKYLKNQDNYSKWSNMDPDMKKSYEGTDGTVGFVSRWESDNKEVGVGEQEIKKITEGERIDFELRFFKPFEATEPAFMTTETVAEDQTKVKWGFSGHMNYPMNIMMLFMDFEQMIGDDLQTGLDKLKTVLESQPSTPDGSISFLENYYNSTESKLKNVISGLSEAQLNFKPSADQWSVAQCLEHIIASEQMLFEMGKKEMEKPAQPERKAEIETTDAELIKMTTDRSEKYQAPQELQPSDKYSNAQLALTDFTAGRQPILSYIKSANLENLRNHISEYPTGKSDGYQNFLFVAAHTARHTKQIEEIKSNQAFPKN